MRDFIITYEVVFVVMSAVWANVVFIGKDKVTFDTDSVREQNLLFSKNINLIIHFAVAVILLIGSDLLKRFRYQTVSIKPEYIKIPLFIHIYLNNGF